MCRCVTLRTECAIQLELETSVRVESVGARVTLRRIRGEDLSRSRLKGEERKGEADSAVMIVIAGAQR